MARGSSGSNLGLQKHIFNCTAVSSACSCTVARGEEDEGEGLWAVKAVWALGMLKDAGSPVMLSTSEPVDKWRPSSSASTSVFFPSISGHGFD